jgi:hypothetical protein
VTAVASMPRERYTSVQKNELSTCIGPWFDMHARAKGRSTAEACALLGTFPLPLTRRHLPAR